MAVRARTIGVAALGVIAAYVLARGLETSDGALEAFPLGGASGGSLWLKTPALVLGLVLGWGIPGVPLALLSAPGLQGTALLVRAAGLGVGYVCAAGLAFAAIAGHAPHITALLVLLALPCAALAVLSPRAAVSWRHDVPLAVAVVTMIALTVVLWPKLRYEGMNGDGAEAYELSRSLEASRLPWWEMEHGAPPGRFGLPVQVPYITGAYLVWGEMAILGRGELAGRLPFVSSVVLVTIISLGLLRSRSPGVWLYAGAVGAVYILWNAYYVGHEAPRDLAEPAGTDTLTMLLWMAGAFELLAGSAPLAATFMILASATTYAAPLLTIIALAAMRRIDRERAWNAARMYVAPGVVLIAGAVVFGWMSGVLPAWEQQYRQEYWEDIVNPDRRVASGGFVVRFLLMTGALPLLIPIAWKRLSPAARLLATTGAVYLCVIVLASYKNLHYLMPLPWLFLLPASEAAGPRFRLAASLALVAIFAASWPSDAGPRTDTIALGSQTCIQDFDYEGASAVSSALHSALTEPGTTGRFFVSRHVLTRYGLDRGGHDCVLGLSRVAPAGALQIAGEPAAVWTRDLDRLVAWRFHVMPEPSSALFRRPERALPTANARGWTGRINLSEEPGRSLLLTGGARARLLVPVGTSELAVVRLGIKATRAKGLALTVNGTQPRDLVVDSRLSAVQLDAGWRRGWNLLQVDGGQDVALEWIEASALHETEK
jgi:hypothetical protein